MDQVIPNEAAHQVVYQRRSASRLAILAGLAVVGACARDAQPDAPHLLTNTIEYSFVGQREIHDEQGRLLVWEAAVDGEIGGEMRWWFYDPPPLPATEHASARITYYRARWEILSDGNALVAGESIGKTVFTTDSHGVWDGQGVVTEAQPGFEFLIGSKIYETGPVVVGSTSRGLFVMY
jgi:hypothetical protein